MNNRDVGENIERLEARIKALEKETEKLHRVIGMMLSWLPGGLNENHAEVMLEQLEAK